MSIRKRLYDLARSNLNALLDKAADSRSHLGDFTDVELADELERREADQVRQDTVAGAKDQVDSQARKDRVTRERIARERAERVRKQKQQRQNRTRPRPGANNSTRRKTRTKASPGSQRARVRAGRDTKLAKHYAVLEVSPGSTFAEVKRAYRRLIRKYHPDLHRNDPTKLKAASEVSIALTTAYNELEAVLVGGPNR